MPSAMKPSRYTPEQLSGDLKRDMANMVTTQHPILPHAGPSIHFSHKVLLKTPQIHIYMYVYMKRQREEVSCKVFDVICRSFIPDNREVWIVDWYLSEGSLSCVMHHLINAAVLYFKSPFGMLVVAHISPPELITLYH